MTIISVAGTKGSPGATTLALALAAELASDRPTVLIEADADGGDLAVRFEVAEDPGLVTFASQSRRGTRLGGFGENVRSLDNGLRVLLAPTESWRARKTLEQSVSSLLDCSKIEPLVVIDCGRLSVDSPSASLVRSADVRLLVTRPVADQALHLHDVTSRWQLSRSAMQLVVVGGHQSVAAPTAHDLDLPLAGAIPEEPGAVVSLYESTTSRRYRRTRFCGAIGALASKLILDEQMPSVARSVEVEG